MDKVEMDRRSLFRTGAAVAGAGAITMAATSSATAATARQGVGGSRPGSWSEHSVERRRRRT
jgi:hypothetical protein